MIFSYNYTLTSSCASCNIACATCIGPGALLPDCITCNIGYINPGNNICTVCYGNCASCTGLLQNQCTSCKMGTFLSNNICLSVCVNGTYSS